MQLVASDPDGNPLTYSATPLPASLSVNPSSGLISGTLTFTSAGTYTVTATASDGALSNSKTFTWTVTDVSQPPTLTSLSPTSGAVGTSVTISGANFGSTQGTSSVRVNGTVATPTSWSASSIVAPVPSGATTGAVVVTVNGVASNSLPFTVSGAGSLPAPWTTQDVGNPAVAGQASYAAGTFTVAGAGVDIWGTTDQFRFVYQALNGDGSIVARVDSLQNTDPWAKAGVMIREDLTGNAPNVLVPQTAANGTAVQWRTTRGGPSATRAASPGPSRSGSAWSAPATPSAATTRRTARPGPAHAHEHRGDAGPGLSSAWPSRATIPSVTTTATFSNVTVTGNTSLSQMSTSVTETANQTGAPALVSTASGLTRSDYDGDGKADLAAYRPSTGDWQILGSRGHYATAIVTRWGTETDLPVPGDYDGDRRTDLAYYRPSTGAWSVLKSSTNYVTSFDVVLGTDKDLPVPEITMEMA